MEDTERADTEAEDTERDTKGELLENGHVRNIKTIGRNNYFVFGELLSISQGEVHRVVLVVFDNDLFFHPVAMKAQTLNRNEIFTGRNFGNRDPIVKVGFEDFKNDTSPCTIIAIKND